LSSRWDRQNRRRSRDQGCESQRTVR